jgi:Chalcone isomerase-like
MWSSSRSRARDTPRRAAVLALALLLAQGPATAVDIDWPTPEQARAHLAPHLAGAARLTWFGFHVYDARLYVPPAFDVDRAAAYPFVLELTYARALEGRAIAQASRDEIERLGFGTPAQRQRWFAQMLAIFPDVQPGQRIAGVNVPGRGARFSVDGRAAGGIEDGEFALAFFAIWLDPRTGNPQVRADLLRDSARN